jgi:hypothetical protein
MQHACVRMPWACGVGNAAHAEKKSLAMFVGCAGVLFLPPWCGGLFTWLVDSSGVCQQTSSPVLVLRVAPATPAPQSSPACRVTLQQCTACTLQQLAALAGWCGWVNAWHQRPPPA